MFIGLVWGLADGLVGPIEQQDEIGLIKRSLNLDPAKLQAYVVWVAEIWTEKDFASLNKQAEAAAIRPAQAAE